MLPAMNERLLAWLLRAWAMTWRWRIVGMAQMRAYRRHGKPLLLGFWHGRLLPLTAFAGRATVPPLRVLISPTRDGRFIGDVATHLGLQPLWGSPEHGGARA